MLVSHREVLHEAKNNEVMKIFKKLPDQAYLLVRDPEHTWFVRSHGLNQLRKFLRSMGIWTSICSIHCTGKSKYDALFAINGFVNKSWAQNFGIDGTHTVIAKPTSYPQQNFYHKSESSIVGKKECKIETSSFPTQPPSAISPVDQHARWLSHSHM